MVPFLRENHLFLRERLLERYGFVRGFSGFLSERYRVYCCRLLGLLLAAIGFSQSAIYLFRTCSIPVPYLLATCDQNRSKCAKSDQNAPKPTKTRQNRSKPIKTHQNAPKAIIKLQNRSKRVTSLSGSCMFAPSIAENSAGMRGREKL